MNLFQKILIPAAVLGVLVGCQPDTATETIVVTKQSDIQLPVANKQAIQAHLEFLASDLLEGRNTGERGHEIASAYIASQFQALGLEPAGTEGYYQRITFRTAKLEKDSAEFILHGDKDLNLTFLDDFTASPSTAKEETSVTAPLVFVGYGLVSEQFDFDDYAGLDVDGAIVVMLPGVPENLPSEEGAHLGRSKTSFALERGALGVVTLHTPKQEEKRPFKMMQRFAYMPRMTWLSPEGESQAESGLLEGAAYLNYEAAAPLFAKVDTQLEHIWEQLDAGEMPLGINLGLQATLKRKSSFEEVTSPNVIARLPGANPALADEVVLYTAHSDHLGPVHNKEGKPEFNNGAMDNAAGVAVMLDTARLFVEAAASGIEFDRTILFAAVTAEERGLLGADYFAHYPTVPIENIVANVNLDMPVLLYDFADVIAFGAEHSSLGGIVSQAAEMNDLKQSPDPMPEQSIFTRSDHYAFVKKGVPAVFLMTGFESKTEGEDGGEVWNEFFEKYYHKPKDEVSTLEAEYGIRYDSAAVFTQVNFDIGRLIANDSEKPYWLPESSFGKAFAQ